ncbi:MAG: hypothetical protein MUP36_02260 [Demequinaceae bacterium]|nr:hypothetical protein [Demequinaceae bacterium]
MNNNRSLKDRRTIPGDYDRGSAAGWAIGVLSAILVGLIVFVALKYILADDEPVTLDPTSQTPSADPSPTPSETPTPEAGPFDGTWTGDVTGDLHLYTVDVVMTDDGSVLTGNVSYTGDASYPEMDCVGVWTQTARHNNHVDVHEVITNGPLCIDELDITLDLKPNGTIAFAIFYSDTYHPKAILTREG